LHFIGEKNPFIRNVFTLNSCAPIVATDVIECYDQGEMLQAWRDFVIEACILVIYLDNVFLILMFNLTVFNR
jgi:hypothetical protein